MSEPSIAANAPRQAVPEPATPKGATDRPVAGGWLTFAALAWLLVAILAGRRSLTGDSHDLDLVQAAAMLPALVQASMLAGATVGVWAVARLARRGWNTASGLRRAVIGTGGGLPAGILAGAAVMVGFGMPTEAAAVVAGAVGVAAGLGGALSAAPPARFAPAAVAGAGSALVVIIISYGANILIGRSRLLAAFGADGTPEGAFAANGLLAATLALATGILAGLVAYLGLRRSIRHTGAVLPWPGYAVAGAGAGLMLILSELLIRLGVPQLLAMAVSDVSADEVAQTMAAGSRLNTGIVVMFVGAICAIIAVGRTLGRKSR